MVARGTAVGSSRHTPGRAHLDLDVKAGLHIPQSYYGEISPAASAPDTPYARMPDDFPDGKSLTSPQPEPDLAAELIELSQSLAQKCVNDLQYDEVIDVRAEQQAAVATQEATFSATGVQIGPQQDGLLQMNRRVALAPRSAPPLGPDLSPVLLVPSMASGFTFASQSDADRTSYVARLMAILSLSTERDREDRDRLVGPERSGFGPTPPQVTVDRPLTPTGNTTRAVVAPVERDGGVRREQRNSQRGSAARATRAQREKQRVRRRRQQKEEEEERVAAARAATMVRSMR
eukprot:COSAG05_NODE_816_length_7150_cov_3.975606_2_plen_290_part_00